MVEQCPGDDPDVEINLGCLLYKVIYYLRAMQTPVFQLWLVAAKKTSAPALYICQFCLLFKQYEN